MGNCISVKYVEFKMRLIVVGRTGHGKSTVCNRLLGLNNYFYESENLSSETKKCKSGFGRLFGKRNLCD